MDEEYKRLSERFETAIRRYYDNPSPATLAFANGWCEALKKMSERRRSAHIECHA